MKWVPDKTGRFPERPHYEPDELDSECERIVENLLLSRHREIRYPISTDDLILMLEKAAQSLDSYADLGGEDVWGETTFLPGKKPKVRISKLLSEDERFENPFRTTITHEFSHIHLHAFLYEMNASGRPSVCRRAQNQSPTEYDWMEWQAGYCSGALLMPKSAVHRLILELNKRWGFVTEAVETGTLQGQVLIAGVSATFRVSEDAARVRLVKLGYSVERSSRLRVP